MATSEAFRALLAKVTAEAYANMVGAGVPYVDEKWELIPVGSNLTAPEPGDICVVHTGTPLTIPIEVAETLASGFRTRWDHAVMASRYVSNSATGQRTLMIVEAQPRGAVEVPWYYSGKPHKWSTGILPPCPAAGEQAIRLVGTPYSWLDYLAIAAHSWHIPAPGLREYVAATGHMICSQLVDAARNLAGSHLFTDNRWPGYVMPSDIGRLLGV